MTISLTKELFTPFKDPEREFRSSRKHFKTLSLEESRSPDFDLFSDQEEYSEEEVAETMAETMEQYMSKTRADYESGNSTYLGLRKKYRLNLKNDMPPRRWEDPTLLWKNTSGSRKKKLENMGKCLTGKLLKTLSCEPTVSSLNNNKIDFIISIDESDDEDYMVVFDKNSWSYKIISTNDLKTDSENDYEKVNIPLFSSPEPSVRCIDDLDFFKDFKNEFSAIVYNDALTPKFDFSTEPTLCPQHIDEFDLKDETSLSKYDEVEQNVLYFNDLCPFNIICPDDQNRIKAMMIMKSI
ncbi:hypothetical protein Tco_0420651 [Tanacetum coccineum]